MIFKDMSTTLNDTVGIIWITGKQVFSEISPDVQNAYSQ